MKLLQEMTSTPSVPGREERIRELIRKHVKPLVDEVRVDTMGSLITLRRPRPRRGSKQKRGRRLRVMLAAHMDQIGFLVKHIDEKGFVRVNPVGGFDTRNLFARNAIVCSSDGDLSAVLNPSGKPVHIASEEESKKIPEVGEFSLDLGLSGREVKRKVKVGDMVVLEAQFRRLGNNVAAQCLDNRLGCWAVIRALEKLKNHDCEIHAVWTVQEEVGLRGAGPAAFGIEPDVAFSCDTTLCCDTPGVPADQSPTTLGDGIGLKVMDSSTIADIKLLEDLERMAKKNKIRTQRCILPRGGQDGGAIQRSMRGVRVAIFACPVRYIHTVTEMASINDIHAYRDLLAAWLAQA